MDIAQLGISADTSSLDAAGAKLNAFKSTAGGASAAADMLSNAMGSVAQSALEAANASVTSAKAIKSAAEAEAYRLKITKDSTKEQKELARVTLQNAELALKAAKADRDRTKERLALNQAIAATKPTLVVDNDQRPNRFNTANIAAQFQDIGVTAAMGMNPMVIALQQGTQLSAIMNSMKSPLTGIKEALSQVFNTVSLGTIAIVGLVAGLAQMVNWTEVGAGGLDLLASAVDALAPAVVGLTAGMVALGIAMTIMNWGSVVAGVTTATTAIWAMAAATGGATLGFLKMAAAWAITPIGAITIAITALFTYLANESGVFDKAGDAVRGWATDLRNAKDDVNSLSKTINEQTDDLYAQLTALKLHGRERAIFLKEEEIYKNAVKGYKGPEGEQKRAFEKQAREQAKIFAPGLANMQTEIDNRKKAERDSTKKDPYEEIVKGAQNRIAILQAESDAIGMNEEATNRLKYQTELLNQAYTKGLKLSPDQREALMALGSEMANIEAQNKRLKQTYDFLQTTTKGFFGDMKQGLSEGKSAWESFGNAIANVLNKIADKLSDVLLDKAFNSLKSSSSDSGIGSIISTVGTLLLSANGNAFGSSGVIPFAKGGAFTNSVVNGATPFAFAGGGAFGVMGEAGPEAVMPLHRGSDGSLGVRVSGGGEPMTMNNVININVSAGGDSQGGNNQKLASTIAAAVDAQLQQSMVKFTQRQQKVGGMLSGGTVVA